MGLKTSRKPNLLSQYCTLSSPDEYASIEHHLLHSSTYHHKVAQIGSWSTLSALVYQLMTLFPPVLNISHARTQISSIYITVITVQNININNF